MDSVWECGVHLRRSVAKLQFCYSARPRCPHLISDICTLLALITSRLMIRWLCSMFNHCCISVTALKRPQLNHVHQHWLWWWPLERALNLICRISIELHSYKRLQGSEVITTNVDKSRPGKRGCKDHTFLWCHLWTAPNEDETHNRM